MSAGRGRQRPTRRELLLAALLAGGALAVPGGVAWLSARRRAGRLETVRDAVPEEVADSVRRLGEAYLATRPEVDAASLRSALDARLAPWPPGGLRDVGLRRRLRAAVERDFAREATVVVAGLALAQTTASLCALAALAARAADAGGGPTAAG